MKTRKQNRDNKQTEMERFDWFIEWIKRAWLWLVKRTLRRKNFMPENILEIALTSYCMQHDWPTDQTMPSPD